MTPPIAYIAGLLDIRGYLTTRVVNGNQLPVVSLMQKDGPLVHHLCMWTGVGSISVKRDYNRSPCSSHCEDQHQRVVGEYQRWVVVGAKATIVLYNVVPHMYVQRDLALDLIALGMERQMKSQTVKQMQELGWTTPTADGKTTIHSVSP